MNAVDTNVLVYHIDTRDPVKQTKAQALLGGMIANGQDAVLLWQVAGEFLQQLRRWEGQKIVSSQQVKQFFGDVRTTYRLILPTNNVLDRSLDLASRFSLSHWDSMIVAARRDEVVYRGYGVADEIRFAGAGKPVCMTTAR